jgi:hypothetical protein
MKLNVLLAKTEHSASQFKKLLSEYVAYFKGKQSDFKGIKKTYIPREGVIDEPAMRGTLQIVTTVGEKLDWLKTTTAQHIDNLFSVEATNSSGTARANLIVGDIDFGSMSSLELLRLNSMLDNGDFDAMYQNIPVRSDAETWVPTTNEMYAKRAGVVEAPLSSGIKKSITKEDYILKDPNLEGLKDASRYTPVVKTKDTILELGDYTIQHFSGEATHRERAEILRRKSLLKSAVIEALKVANDVPVIPSEMTSAKLFGYLHEGKI